MEPSLGNLDVSTQAYSLSSIGSTLYLTGQDSATLSSGTGSERDRLQVRIGFHSQRTDCRGGGDLARTDPKEYVTVTGLTAEKTLVQNFTGKGISEPGPYRIEQLFIQCGRDHIWPGTIVVPAS